MRVHIGDLDFGRAEHREEFARRVRTAGRAFCDEHLDLVTPERLGDPSLCRAEMRWLAYRALPQARQRQISEAGRLRAIR